MKGVSQSTDLYVFRCELKLIVEPDPLLSSRVRRDIVQDLYVNSVVAVTSLDVVLGDDVRILLVKAFYTSVGFVFVFPVEGALIERFGGIVVVVFSRFLRPTNTKTDD